MESSSFTGFQDPSSLSNSRIKLLRDSIANLPSSTTVQDLPSGSGSHISSAPISDLNHEPTKNSSTVIDQIQSVVSSVEEASPQAGDSFLPKSSALSKELGGFFS